VHINNTILFFFFFESCLEEVHVNVLQLIYQDLYLWKERLLRKSNTFSLCFCIEMEKTCVQCHNQSPHCLYLWYH